MMENYKKILTVPNILSLSRLLLVPAIMYIIKLPFKKHLILYFLFIMIYLFTDFLDGYIARKYNLTSKLGRLLDHTIDKVALITLGWALVKYKCLPEWIFYVLIIREIVVLMGSLFLIRYHKIVPGSNIFGKIGIFIISIGMLGYVAECLPVLRKFILLGGVILYITATITYFIKYLKITYVRY